MAGPISPHSFQRIAAARAALEASLRALDFAFADGCKVYGENMAQAQHFASRAGRYLRQLGDANRSEAA